MKNLYRVSLACGVLPLVAGISIFLIWLITRWNWLMFAGVITIYSGLAFFSIGTIALFFYYRQAIRLADRPRRHIINSSLVVAGFLLLNFPVALGIVVAALAVETRYTVIVHNATEKPIENIQIIGGGCERSISSLAAGRSAKRSFWVQCDGQLEFTAICDTKPLSKIIDNYVTGNLGGRTKVTITPDKTISVVNDDFD